MYVAIMRRDEALLDGVLAAVEAGGQAGKVFDRLLREGEQPDGGCECGAGYALRLADDDLVTLYRQAWVLASAGRDGLLAPGYITSRPICWQRRLQMKRRYSLNIGAFRPSTPRGMVSSA